jgi:hypothetical protein
MFTLRSFFDWVVLRASVNRDRGRMKKGYEMFHHAGSSPRFPTEEYAPCPRCHHTSTGAHLATVFGPAARAPHRPSARMPALASPRGSFSRSWCKSWSSEAPTRGSPTSLARRARCVEKARGVDRTWSDGSTQADLPGGLRPPHRPRAFGGGRRLLHDLSPLRRGEGGKEPCGPRKTRHHSLDGGVGSAFLTLGGEGRYAVAPEPHTCSSA